MTLSVLRKPHRITARALLGALLAMSAVPLLAQRSANQYEVSQEVTISGAISAVVTKKAPGMLVGAHLLLTTTSGQVDASLGRFALQGKDALPVTVGQQIEVTGMMRTIQGKEVFIVRTVKAGARVYAVRNQHGIEVSPQTRQRAAERGESL